LTALRTDSIYARFLINQNQSDYPSEKLKNIILGIKLMEHTHQMAITTTARATLLVTIQHQSHMPSQHMEDMRVNEEKANRLRTIRDAKKK